jgi:hypothetical protein
VDEPGEEANTDNSTNNTYAGQGNTRHLDRQLHPHDLGLLIARGGLFDGGGPDLMRVMATPPAAATGPTSGRDCRCDAEAVERLITAMLLLAP